MSISPPLADGNVRIFLPKNARVLTGSYTALTSLADLPPDLAAKIPRLPQPNEETRRRTLSSPLTFACLRVLLRVLVSLLHKKPGTAANATNSVPRSFYIHFGRLWVRSAQLISTVAKRRISTHRPSGIAQSHALAGAIGDRQSPETIRFLSSSPPFVRDLHQIPEYAGRTGAGGNPP
jgi:hypothetical protein